MDIIEESIKSYDKSAKIAFNTLIGIASLLNNPDLKQAQVAFDQFMCLTNEVLRLPG